MLCEKAYKGFGMEDYLSRMTGITSTPSAPSWFSWSGDVAKGGMDFLNDNSKGLGALGQLGGAYMQYDMGNKMYDMQKQAFAYNKSLSEREKKRQEDAEKAMQLGFSNSGIGA